MLAADVQRVFEEILPEDVLIPIVNETGFQEREHKLDALKFVRAMVVAASTGYGGRQADVMRMYFKMGAPKVVRGAAASEAQGRVFRLSSLDYANIKQVQHAWR